MSGKLDQSLDEILSSQRRTAKNRRSTRRSSAGNRPAPAAPAGGIQKAKPGRNANKPTPAKGGGMVGESKILVSNLPKDVSEGQIKEYFQQSVGQVKKVELSYGPGGISRGIANVLFHHADGAQKAYNTLNGLLIDDRPVKVEIIVASTEFLSQPKPLGQRISQPKPQPKSAAIVKQGANGNGKGGVAAGKAGKKPVGRRARNSRPAKKTAEELDSEMADYFDAGNTDAANTATAPVAAANGDAPMEDEIL